MCQATGWQQDDDVPIQPTIDSNINPNVSNPTPAVQAHRPLSLQFVAMGPGGTVKTPSVVRSHVMKGSHQKKREAKKAYMRQKTLQSKAQLLPSQKSQLSKSGDGNATERTLVRRETPSPTSPLKTTVQYQANLIPYAWFEKSGPVLYVDRTKWPFPQPLEVTGSDRSDHSFKNLVPRQSNWMPYARSPDHSVVRGAVLDPNVLAWIGQSPECYQFRLQCIQWIQDQLADDEKAVSNATLGSIMTFTMWTAGYGNTAEMCTHMDAVEKIVKLKGGFQAFYKDPTMTAKLVLFDSMIAVLTGLPPRFPPVTYHVTHPLSKSNTSRLTNHVSPLQASPNLSKIQHPDTAIQDAIIAIVSSAWCLTQAFLSSDTTNERSKPSTKTPTINFKPEPQLPYRTPLLTLPLLSSCNQPSHNHLLQTLHLASSLYARALSPSHTTPTDFPSPLNTTLFTSLLTHFSKCSHEEFWTRYPGILLWVTLVGTASSRGKKESAFWMFYLSRQGSFGDAESWVVGSESLMAFLRVQKGVRRRLDGGREERGLE